MSGTILAFFGRNQGSRNWKSRRRLDLTCRGVDSHIRDRPWYGFDAARGIDGFFGVRVDVLWCADLVNPDARDLPVDAHLPSLSAFSCGQFVFRGDIRHLCRGLAGQSTVVFSVYSGPTIGGRLRGGLLWRSHRCCFSTVGCCDAVGATESRRPNPGDPAARPTAT